MTFLLPCLNTPLIIPVRYTAKSDYFLIPVYPNAKAVTSFVEATHPMHLDNYGNRAWCRLEVYVFSCLVEIQSRPISCFAFGLHTSVSSDDEISESMMKTGMTSRSMLRCLGSVSKEKLVPLFGHASGAAFATTYLPSSGDLTVEDDRDVVRDIEKIIQTAYSTFAIKKETDRLLGKNNGSSLSTRDCVLNSKQIHDRDIVFLSKTLSGISVGGQFLQKVNLRDNMITDVGVKMLLREFITVDDYAGGRRVQTLDLGGNPIGRSGAMLFEQYLVAEGCCALDHLGLASTGLGPEGVLGVASWLGRAAQLVEVDLRGNGAFGAEAVEALIASMEEHGRVLVVVDDEAREGLSPAVVRRFEQASRNNITAEGLDAV